MKSERQNLTLLRVEAQLVRWLDNLSEVKCHWCDSCQSTYQRQHGSACMTESDHFTASLCDCSPFRFNPSLT